MHYYFPKPDFSSLADLMPWLLAAILPLLTILLASIVIEINKKRKFRQGQLARHYELNASTALDYLPNGLYRVLWWQKFLPEDHAVESPSTHFYLEYVPQQRYAKPSCKFYIIAPSPDLVIAIKDLARHEKMLAISQGALNLDLLVNAKKKRKRDKKDTDTDEQA